MPLRQVESCIISSFYIKPQRRIVGRGFLKKLYYIFILHQTTTYTTYIADIQPFENHIGRYEVV